MRDTQEALLKWQERERQLRRTVLLDNNHLTEGQEIQSRKRIGPETSPRKLRKRVRQLKRTKY